jgi:hypothetical protein
VNEDDKKMFLEMFDRLPPDLKAAFESAVTASGMSREQFVEGLLSEIASEDVDLSLEDDEMLRSMFIGDCPECGSKSTVPGDEIEDVDDPTVACCRDCALAWCLECGMTLSLRDVCGHWAVCDDCSEEKDEYGDCGIMPADCPNIVEWQAKRTAESLSRTCAWCGSEIPESGEVFGTGAKIREGIDFVQAGGREGFFMEVTIAGRRVPAVVTGKDSDARRAGNDLMFMTCGLRCAEELKKALETEREVIEKAQLN